VLLDNFKFAINAFTLSGLFKSAFWLICRKLDAIDFNVLSANPEFLHLSNVFIILFLVSFVLGSSSSLVKSGYLWLWAYLLVKDTSLGRWRSGVQIPATPLVIHQAPFERYFLFLNNLKPSMSVT